MRDKKPIDLLYQLRKSLLYLNKAYVAAAVSGEKDTQREIKKCIDSLKRQISVLATGKK